MSIATDFRPKTFKSVVGQKAVVASLQGAIQRGALPNAVMLCGPTGVGKTTVARVFARAINCEHQNACGKCASCKHERHPDVEEANAATERGIDEVRALIERSKFLPRYNMRVVILDESHQWTPQAAQAMLKILEEPPSKTIFVLCTTDPEKFPDAILGRCTVLRLQHLATTAIEKRLNTIAEHLHKKGDLLVPPETVALLARESKGHMRNALNFLELALNAKTSNPDIGPEALATLVAGSGSDATTNQQAADLLIGMWSRDVNLTVRAVYAINDFLKVVNQALYFNEFLLSQTVKAHSRHTWPSKDNLAFAKAIKAEGLTPSVPEMLDAESRLAALRNVMFSVPTREVTLALTCLIPQASA